MDLELQGKQIKLIISDLNGFKTAEVISDEILIPNIRKGTDLLVDIYYQGIDHIIINEKNITPDFFNLKSGMAGEILQSISNFRFKLSIKGDISKYDSKSLHSFIAESNDLGQISFIK